MHIEHLAPPLFPSVAAILCKDAEWVGVISA